MGLWVETSTECECTVGDLDESHSTHGACAGGGSCLNSSNNVNVLSETEELMVYVWMETHIANLSLMGQVLSEVHVYISPLTVNALPQMQTSSPALPLHALQEADTTAAALMVHILCETDTCIPASMARALQDACNSLKEPASRLVTALKENVHIVAQTGTFLSEGLGKVHSDLF